MHRARAELERLGPERVRMAMRAFHYPRGDVRCFLVCAANPGESLCDLHIGSSLVEAMFEAWIHYKGVNPGSREELRQECIVFLAEHGTASESEIATAREQT